MWIGRIEQIAQQIVDATAPLVGGRTINIMDLSGVIIASSDAKRIGTFHPGAARAIESGQPVLIHKQDIPRYPGAREGVNLPILREGKLLGVVGILGEPREVTDAANLLRVCVELYLDQEAAVDARQAKKEVRLAVLRALVLGAESEAGEAYCRAKGIFLPVRVAVVTSSPPNRRGAQAEDQLEQAEAALVEMGFLQEAEDVYGMLGEQLVLVLRDGRDAAEIQKLLDIRCAHALEVAVGASARCWEEVPLSFQEAVRLSRLPGAFMDVADNRHRLLYLMDSMQEQARDRMLEPMYEKLLAGIGLKNISWMLETVRVWCETGRSAPKAAELLRIHKNTLIYRMKKVETLLELEQEDAFVREALLRMLLLYHDTRRNK